MDFCRLVRRGLIAASPAVFVVFASSPAPALASNCIEGTHGGFLPENTLRIEEGALETSKIDQKTFNSVIDKVESLYAPVVAEKGGELVIERKWKDSTVNAYASRKGHKWIVSMFGGLARHPMMTVDGLVSVVCHELGHHLGGVPRKMFSWAANEGEADYFATLKCMRNVMSHEENPVLADVPLALTQACQKSFNSNEDIRICERDGMAGLTMARLLSAVRKEKVPPSFDTPDPTVVKRTSDAHPLPQCRLDTYFAGAICDKDWHEEIGENDVSQGACSVEKRENIGVRPLCWYKPEGARKRR